MTEEIKDTPQEITPPTVEEQAKAMGWRPLDEYEGDRSKWVNAEIFVARAPLFEKIEADKKLHRREIEELKAVVKDLAEHNKKVGEAAYKKALEDLKQQKKAAIAEGDTVKALEISDEIQELKENKPTEVAPVPVSPNPVFMEWIQQNPWYLTDQELAVEAENEARRLLVTGHPRDAELLQKIEKHVKKAFPDKFGIKKVVAPASPEGPKGGSLPKNSFKLTPEEERVMNRFIKSGALSKEEYIEQLKATRG